MRRPAADARLGKADQQRTAESGQHLLRQARLRNVAPGDVAAAPRSRQGSLGAQGTGLHVRRRRWAELGSWAVALTRPAPSRPLAAAVLASGPFRGGLADMMPKTAARLALAVLPLLAACALPSNLVRYD